MRWTRQRGLELLQQQPEPAVTVFMPAISLFSPAMDISSEPYWTVRIAIAGAGERVERT